MKVILPTAVAALALFAGVPASAQAVLFDQTTTTGAYDNRFVSQIFVDAGGSKYGAIYDTATVDDLR